MFKIAENKSNSKNQCGGAKATGSRAFLAETGAKLNIKTFLEANSFSFHSDKLFKDVLIRFGQANNLKCFFFFNDDFRKKGGTT